MFFTISEITINEEIIKFEEIIKNDLKEAELFSSTSTQNKVKLEKYKKKNLTNITNNFLIELLKQVNFQIKINSTRQSKCVVKMNRISCINHNQFGSFSLI